MTMNKHFFCVLVLVSALQLVFIPMALSQDNQCENDPQAFIRRPDVQTHFLGCTFGNTPKDLIKVLGRRGIYIKQPDYIYYIHYDIEFGGARWKNVTFSFDSKKELYCVTFTQTITESLAGDAISTIAAAHAFYDVMLECLKERYGDLLVDVSTNTRRESEYRGPNNVQVTLSCYPGVISLNRKAMIVDLEYIDLTRDDAEYMSGINEL